MGVQTPEFAVDQEEVWIHWGPYVPGHLKWGQSYEALTCGICANSEVSVRAEMQDIQLLSGKCWWNDKSGGELFLGPHSFIQ